MMMVDTSAMIDLLRGTGSPAHRRLARAMREQDDLFFPPVVLQEVLQGARSPADYATLVNHFEVLPIYESEDIVGLHSLAGLLYARCRWRGLTVRSPIDCIVAASAVQSGLPLLACDRDFASISMVEPRLELLALH